MYLKKSLESLFIYVDRQAESATSKETVFSRGRAAGNYGEAGEVGEARERTGCPRRRCHGSGANTAGEAQGGS